MVVQLSSLDWKRTLIIRIWGSEKGREKEILIKERRWWEKSLEGKRRKVVGWITRLGIRRKNSLRELSWGTYSLEFSWLFRKIKKVDWSVYRKS